MGLITKAERIEAMTIQGAVTKAGDSSDDEIFCQVKIKKVA